MESSTCIIQTFDIRLVEKHYAIEMKGRSVQANTELNVDGIKVGKSWLYDLNLRYGIPF